MTSQQTQRSGYQSTSSLSPASLAGVVIVHLGLGAAILSMTAITVIPRIPDVIWTTNIRAEPPKTDPVEPPKQPKIVDTRITTTTPTIDLKPVSDNDFVRTGPVLLDPGPGPIIEPVRTIDPPPTTPVMVEARPDARFKEGFQPPYPAAMLRLQTQGNVIVRILIGADGRVQNIFLVSGEESAFFEATRKQALSRWRFVPATRDGVPVASERVMTVRFRLTE